MVRFASHVELALGADLTADPSTWSWTDVSAYVHHPAGITIQRGRPDWYSQTPPARCQLTFINNSGRFVPRNPTGPYYGQLARNTPLRVRLGNSPSTQFVGYVDEWPTRWADASGNQSFAPITASGLLRRIQQGAALRSAMFRANTEGYFGTGSAVAYWPLEDESSSTSLASGLDGGSPMAIQGDVSLASDSTLPGSSALVRFSTTTASSIAGIVPAYAAATSWAIRAAIKVDTEVSDAQALLRWQTGGTIPLWQLVLTPGSPSVLTLQGYSSGLVEQLGDTGANWYDLSSTELYGQWIYYEIEATQNGTAIDWEYNFNFAGGFAFGATGTEASATIGNVTDVGFGFGWGASLLTDVSIGHIAVSTDTNFGPGQFGLTGYAGETTSQRLIRLDAELKVPTMFGNIAHPSEIGTQAMGPQTTSSAVDQFRQIADTEAGILFDGKQGHITILPRALRENADVAIAMTVASGDLGWPFEAADDDQLLRNDITASRPSGSSARATDRTSIATVGVYTDSVTVNPQSDGELSDFANWRLHLGTIDDLRYPQVVLNFARTSGLITSWQAADIGSRIQITGPPSELPPDTLDLIIEGYTENFDGHIWTATLNTSPAQAWQVFELEDTDLGALEGGSHLLAAATAGATSLLVANEQPSPSGLWSTVDEPYDWAIAGERVTVTNMATNAISYVGVGTAAHAVDANVTPGMPASIVKGDLLLCWAATRGTSGTVGLPSGWTSLVQLANVRLIGKIYDGSEAAPTIVMTSSGGNDCSAQIAAWRNAQLSLVASTSQTNGGAQDIAVPALTGLDRNNCLVVVCGWKQDDWTSVATLSGYTEIAEFTATAGADHGLVWDYVIQTTVAATSSTTFTVTGGTSQQSKAVVVALAGDVQTATVTRAVNGVSKAQAANADVSLWRSGVLAL